MISLDSAAIFFRKITFSRGKPAESENFSSTIFSDINSFFVIKKSMGTYFITFKHKFELPIKLNFQITTFV
jgi:hypothetical protein